MHGHEPLFAALAPDFQDAVTAVRLIIPHPQPAQFTNTTSTVSEHGKKRPIPNSFWGVTTRRIEHAPAILWRQADGLAILGYRRHGDEITVGWVCPRIAEDLQITEQRSEHRDL